jgi:type I restriction enzyme, R subunit
MAFNENTRVKIPAILHCVRLGYTYLSLRDNTRDEATNIFTNIFNEAVSKINKDIEPKKLSNTLAELRLLLDAEDLGKSFYERLLNQSGVKLIDFENFDHNIFNVVTELTYKNGDEEFRPDITLLINGMPLVFIEVKKPNNRDGILDERKRLGERFQNKRFTKFISLTQFMIFSNNMEYDNEDTETIQGAFYATTSYQKPSFNYFREEDNSLIELLLDENDEVENDVLVDNNLVVIKHSPEFLTNKKPLSPTNKLLTSLCSKARLQFVLKYAITYVEGSEHLEKHIMRYPQLFATKAIQASIDKGTKKGIIWHTQGSGKTALTFYNVRFLTDVFQKKGIVPKFYFIVDRLDLLVQAQREFKSRGLTVHTVNSRLEFINDIKKISAIHNHSGNNEITVVNIQKFSEEANVVAKEDYDISIQRIYFLDEVHRSYNPKGSFLANLTQSDTNAVIVGLTGTPLITNNLYSKAIFGDYIHKYYYNASIKDGYTLRLIREEIETNYKITLQEILNEIEVLKGDVERKIIYAHQRFVEPMLDYIITDFEKSRIMFADNSIGGMVVCDSSEQAKALYNTFLEKYAAPIVDLSLSMVADPEAEYCNKKSNKANVKRAALILHDIGTKEERNQQVEDFKDGKIDMLFVYNMLLTGFDAKRLKKLYLGRVIKQHNLLQTLTRVNRPYENFKYGFVVDFADIRKEFDATNKAYFEELQTELGDEIEHYSNLFKSKEEIEREIIDIKEVLFHFDTINAEIFSQQINQIQDRNQMLLIKKALGNAKNLYNLIRFFGHFDLIEKIDFQKLSQLYTEASNHLDLLNTKEALQNNTNTINLLNVALENVLFMFTKVSEEELILADQLKDILGKTREALNNNFDQNDPQFTSLYEELKRLFDKKNLDEITQDEMKNNIGALRIIYDKIGELNRKNNLLKAKYENDAKYARVHKRLLEKGNVSNRETQLFEALQGVKHDADLQVLQNNRLLKNESYFEQQMVKMVIDNFIKKNKIELDAETTKGINSLIIKEYSNEFYGRNVWQ